jgi:hypothetical protein
MSTKRGGAFAPDAMRALRHFSIISELQDADPASITYIGKDRWRITWDDGTEKGFVVEFNVPITFLQQETEE